MMPVEFALDDLAPGVPYCRTWKHFPVSYIKMDKCFTQDILREKTSRHIMESVVGLAGNLGINTVAEGGNTGADELSMLYGDGLFTRILLGGPKK